MLVREVGNRIVPSVEGLAREAWVGRLWYEMCDALGCVCEPFFGMRTEPLMRRRGLLQLAHANDPSH